MRLVPSPALGFAVFNAAADTPFYLRFHLLGIPVRVAVSFWIMTALFAFDLLTNDFAAFLLWVACVFVSILVHEMGHALTGRYFGVRPHVVLYSFGGLAINASGLYHRWQRIAVLLAGPFAGFAFLAVVAGAMTFLPPEILAMRYVSIGIRMLYFVNLAWGLFNLLPIWPLDGGQITHEVIDHYAPRDALSATLTISLVTNGIMLLASLPMTEDLIPSQTLFSVPMPDGRWFDVIVPIRYGLFGLLLFGSLAVENFMQLQVERARRRRPFDHPDDRLPWEREDERW